MSPLVVLLQKHKPIKSKGDYSGACGHLLYTDNIKIYILFLSLTSSPNGGLILVCWLLQRHSRRKTM